MNNDEKKIPVEPLCLALIEADAEIANAIIGTARKHKIPFYMLEPIVAKHARQVSDLAAAERKKAKAVYEKQLEEYGKDGANDG